MRQSTKTRFTATRASMLFYRAALPLSRKTLTFASGAIRRHRAAIGSGWRKLNSGHAYVVADGTLIPIDPVAAARPSRSGKHRKHGMNLQVRGSTLHDVARRGYRLTAGQSGPRTACGSATRSSAERISSSWRSS